VVADFGANEQLVIHAFKENGQTSLAGFLANPLAGPLRQITNASSYHLLVPVPSSRENYKKRGFMPTNVLAKRVSRAFGQGCAVANALSFRRKVEDQSRLDSNSRRKNLEGSMLADARVSGRQVVLFDDVVTTGSTMLEAGRAVTLAGGNVIGFLAFAETILKTYSKT
jgi:ComF family protein